MPPNTAPVRTPDDPLPYPGRAHPQARSRPKGSRRGPVLVAVDDSAAAATIARYGAALAASEHRQLLALTVIPSATGHPGIGARAGDDTDLLTMECVHSDGAALLTELARTPAARAVAPRLLVAGYRARGGSRRVARRVATTILAVAHSYRAAVIVIGLPDQPRPRAQSARSRAVQASATVGCIRAGSRWSAT